MQLRKKLRASNYYLRIAGWRTVTNERSETGDAAHAKAAVGSAGQGASNDAAPSKGKSRKRTWLEKHVPSRHALKEWVEIGGWISIIIEAAIVAYLFVVKGHLAG